MLVAAVAVAVSFMGPGNSSSSASAWPSASSASAWCRSPVGAATSSICQLTFAGLGAFAMYRFGHHGNVLGLLAAAALAGAVGAIVVLFVLRLRGLYLALATMAFAAAMDNVFFPCRPSSASTARSPSPSPRSSACTSARPRPSPSSWPWSSPSSPSAILALRRGPFGRVLVAIKDSEAACATLGLSLTTTKLLVFTLSAAMAGLAGAFLGAASSVASGTDFEMFESLLILAVVAIGGASVCSGALAGGLALGFLPGNAEDIFIGAGTVVLAFYSDGVLPLFFARFQPWWSGLTGPDHADPRSPLRHPGAGAWTAQVRAVRRSGPGGSQEQGLYRKVSTSRRLAAATPGIQLPAGPGPGSDPDWRERGAAVAEPVGASVDRHAFRSTCAAPWPWLPWSVARRWRPHRAAMGRRPGPRPRRRRWAGTPLPRPRPGHLCATCHRCHPRHSAPLTPAAAERAR